MSRSKDFSLLEYFRVEDPTKIDANEELRRKKLQERRTFNEYQYEQHIIQEQKNRERIEQSVNGRACRSAHQMRDQRHHYGNFWFAQGLTPPSNVVGSAREKVPTIVFPLGAAGEESSRERSHEPSPPVATQNAPDAAQPTQQGGTFLILQPKMAPPVAAPPSRSRSSSPQTGPRRVPSAPFAEHYETDMLYTVPAPSDTFAVGGFHAQCDRYGIPRGANGVDAEEARARHAQRLAEEMHRRAGLEEKRERQKEMKEALDNMVAAKRMHIQEERKKDARDTFGACVSSLPSGENALSPAQRKLQREQLEKVWQAQMAEKEQRAAAERAFYAPPEEVAAPPLSGGGPTAAPADPSQKLWLQAWQEHQYNEGLIKKAEMERELLRQQNAIAPNVLNYSERILEAERQRLESQRQCREELDKQCLANANRRRAEALANRQKDRKYHSG